MKKKTLLFGVVTVSLLFCSGSNLVYADGVTGMSVVPVVSRSYIDSLPDSGELTQELLDSATPENPIYIYDIDFDFNDGLPSTYASAPQVAGLLYGQKVAIGKVSTLFTGTATNCNFYSVDYRMSHGDGNRHDKSVRNLNSRTVEIPDSFMTRISIGSITLNLTGQVNTSKGYGIINCAPKAVWMG